MKVRIRSATDRDAAALAAIYNHYVAQTCVTFETDPVSAAEMVDRISECDDAGLPWLVSDVDGRLAGYAYASKWKGRCAYRYSVESTVYLHPDETGKGLGRQLYAALLDAIRTRSMHAVIGGIALPNEASIALHERLGFSKVAHFAEVGFKQQRWIDVGYWQLLLAGRGDDASA